MLTVLAAESGGGSSAIGSFLPLILIGALVYFMMIRPQRKKTAEFKALQEQLAVGDDVVTIGGIHGRVESIGEQTVDLAVMDDVVLRFRRSAIQDVIRDEPITVEEMTGGDE